MAALTQAQWFAKLKGWVPTWVFETEYYQVAVFQALAKLLNEADVLNYDKFAQTFITQAIGDILDQHGYERGVIRYSGELDVDYAERIRSFTSSLDPVTLKNIVDSFLLVGECTLIEHDIDGCFLDVECFFDRRNVLTDRFYCYFTFVFDYQGAGSGVTDQIQKAIPVVNAAKALGTLYTMTERRP